MCVVPVTHVYSFKVAMKTRHEQFINLDSVKCMYTYVFSNSHCFDKVARGMYFKSAR